MNILSRLAGKNRNKEKGGETCHQAVSPLGLEIVFFKDNGSNTYHGTIYARLSHLPVDENKKPDIVSFYFKDVHPVPALTPEVLTYIAEQAKAHGWDMVSLRSYVTVFTVMPQPQSPVMAQRSVSVPTKPSA